MMNELSEPRTHSPRTEQDAVRVGLRLITMQPNHRAVRENLATCALHPSAGAVFRQGMSFVC